MSSRDITTSVKLDARTRTYLKHIARLRNRSVHSLIKAAVEDLVERELIEEWKPRFELGFLSGEFADWAALTEPGSKSGLPPHVQKQIKDGNNRLRVLRGWRGMSLEKLSAALADLNVKIAPEELERIEDNLRRPTPGLYVALATALNVSVEDVRG